MPTSTPTRRPRPSAPLFKHSYITFIGHWKGQLCILVVVLIVGLIYFIIRDPIEKWRRGRRERSSAKARAGLLAAVKREKEREKERARDKDRDRSPGTASVSVDGERDGSDVKVVSGQAGQLNHAVSASSLSTAPTGSHGTVENRKSRRRKSSLLKVDTKSQSPTPSDAGGNASIASAGLLGAAAASRSRSGSGSAGMAKSLSASSLASAATGASGSIASRSSTPSIGLPPVSEAVNDGDAGQSERLRSQVEDEDAEDGECKRSTAQEKGKGRASPLPPRSELPSTGTDELRNSIPNGKRPNGSGVPRPSPIHIHVRQPTVVLDANDVQSVVNPDLESRQLSRPYADPVGSAVGSSVAMSTTDTTSVRASSDGDEGDDHADASAVALPEKASSEAGSANDAKDKDKAKEKKRDEGFSIFPDEGWLPPSALATLTGGEKKKKKKGKCNASGGQSGSGSSSVTDSHTAAMVAHANGLVKNGESSRMATSSSGSVSGRSVTSASASTSGSPLSRSQALPPLPSFSSSSASSHKYNHDHNAHGGTGTPPPAATTSAPMYQQHHQRNGSLQFGHSRKASMGKISGTSSLEEQIRERDEIIDNLRAEVGRAKAEEMKARSELEMRGSGKERGGAGKSGAEEESRRDSAGHRQTQSVDDMGSGASHFEDQLISQAQRQLTEALAGMSSQAARIEMLERLIANSGMHVPATNQPIADVGSERDHHQNGPASAGGPRRQSSHHQPRLNRITSMPNGSLNGNGNIYGHSGNLAVPMSPMHPQMVGMAGQQPGNVPYPSQSPMMRQAGPMTPLNHPSPYLASPNAGINLAMQSPHLQYSPHMQIPAQGFNGQFGHALIHPLVHQQQMAQMQIQMMHGQQQQHFQQQQQQQPYTPQRNQFHQAHGNGSLSGPGPASPSPYRRASTATSVGRNADRDRQRESSIASQSEKERERDDNLGVADHPLAGPLTPGNHHASPARYPASIDSGDNGVFGIMQAESLGFANGTQTSEMVEGDEYEQSYGMFPSMQGGMDVGALGYADTGIGRPPGEERGVEGQRRASVESSVLKRKPIEPLTTAKVDASSDASGAVKQGEGGDGVVKSGMEGVVEEVVLDESEDDAPAIVGQATKAEAGVEGQDNAATSSDGQEQGQSNTSSPPSSGPTSPRSRQVLVTPGSTTMEMQDQADVEDVPAEKDLESNGRVDLNRESQEYENQHQTVQSPSPLPRSISSNGLPRPPQGASPMLFPVANGIAQMNGYHSPTPAQMQMHNQPHYAHMGQPSPMLPLSIPLPVSPGPMSYPFPHAQHVQPNGHAGSVHGMKQNATHYETHPDYAQAQVNGMPEAMTVAPRSTASTPLKLPDYTPTFASLAHTPEQLMEIKRMNEEAVRRAVEGSQA